jgi:excisionase family DNA binding protein
MRPRFMPIIEWCEYSGMSRTGTYVALGRGDLRAVKMGRSVRIDVDHGDDYLDRLPEANIRPAA